MRWIVAILVLLLILPVPPGHAQSQLSDEELVLIERIFAAVDKTETYSSFTATTTEFQIIEMKFSILGQNVEFLESFTSNSDGYVIREENSEQSSSTVTVAYTSTAPQNNVDYTIGADVITIDETLYVNAAYIEPDSSLPAIEPGWQSFESADDIPVALQELRLDEVFDADDESLFSRESIRNMASEVTIEAGELSDGTPVDVIRVVVENDILSFLDLTETDDVFGQILSHADLEGEIVFTANLDENDNVLLTKISIMVSISNLDMGVLELEQFPEGTTLSLSVDSTQIGTISDIDAEYQPIEAPIE